MSQWPLLLALLAVLVIVVLAAARHMDWMKKHCTCTGKSGFDGMHGWRWQHYFSNPYNGQDYMCGQGAAREGFAADGEHWPTAGTYGNLADTNPAFNYYDAEQMYHPAGRRDASIPRL